MAPWTGAEVFAALNGALTATPDIDELGFVICDPALLPSPVLVEGLKLGLPYACATALYEHAHGEFQRLRSSVGEGESQNDESDRCLLEATRALVMVNASNYSAWNARKQLIQRGVLVPTDELALMDLVFTKHPKSPDAWAHRRWVLAAMPAGPQRTAAVARDLALCNRIAEAYPKNYYSWTHRQWVVDRLGEWAPREACVALLQADAANTQRWMTMHISDYCGFHHIQYLLYRLAEAPHCGLAEVVAAWPSAATETALAELGAAVFNCDSSDRSAPPCATCTAYADEIHRTLDLCARFPGHEAMWVHLRMLTLIAVAASLAHLGNSGNGVGLAPALRDTTEFVDQCRSGSENAPLAASFSAWCSRRRLSMSKTS
eukprot:m.99061 g.99061  ORF g.99061 m.99061 type:complete len:375 (+) comp8880_c0_seq2:101-1225(+)